MLMDIAMTMDLVGRYLHRIYCWTWWLVIGEMRVREYGKRLLNEWRCFGDSFELFFGYAAIRLIVLERKRERKNNKNGVTDPDARYARTLYRVTPLKLAVFAYWLLKIVFTIIKGGIK